MNAIIGILILVEPPDSERLTIRRPSDILKMRFSDNDLVLKNGYMTKGDPIAICGPPGVGKSRLVMQLAINVLTGREFVGWATNGKGTRWLILQTENGNRRLQYDLGKMLSDLTPEERLTVDEGMFIHTLETEEDALLTLSLD